MQNRKPKLTVLGAGPGDPDLLTIKGAMALADADVVLYDALIDTSLLSYATKADKIFVGKRKGCYVYAQEQINELIVSQALLKGHVVRLKGGDPFVFGRGAEEMEYAALKGLETVYIPGISAALAVSGCQNIPMTKRGSSESFWVITGTNREHQPSKDLILAAQSSATVVILIGMGKLKEIVREFRRFGRNSTPVAIIQDGTTIHEKIGVGTVDSILAVVEREKLSNPAIIVIGSVVSHRDILIQLRVNQQIQMAN